MKFNDDITLDIASAVSDVLEGKTKKEEVKYPHKMYHPETGEEVEVMDKAGHDKYNAKGYVHEKPKNESPEQPRAKGEKDFKDKHVVKKSGEKEDGTVVKEDDSVAKISKEESDKQKKYQAFFAKALKKFGVKSPAELEGDKKKEFFDYVDANYEADNETDESVKEEVEQVDEILGGIKKVAQKVKQKIKGTPKPGTKMKGDGSNDPAQKMMDEIDVLQAKMKEYQKKEKEAADDDKADYWLNAYNNAADKVYDLKQKLKKEVGADMYGEAYKLDEADRLAQKKYANMKAKIGVIQNNIAKTKNNKFRMKNDGQERIDAWNKDIEKIRDIMKKMVDKFGSGVASGEAGFTGGA